MVTPTSGRGAEVSLGSKMLYPHPLPVRSRTVRLGSLRKFPVCPGWVVSRSTPDANISIICMSAFGCTLDVRLP